MLSASAVGLATSVGGVKGRVKVYVRQRPFEADALASRGGCCVHPAADNGIEVLDAERRAHTFHFDRVFPINADNKSVYEEVGRPLVDSVVTGFNGTLMAYGQTGTGKTHTISSAVSCAVHSLAPPHPPTRRPTYYRRVDRTGSWRGCCTTSLRPPPSTCTDFA